MYSLDVQMQQDFRDHSHWPCDCLHYFNGRLEGGERGGCNGHRVTEGGSCSDADANDVTQLVNINRQSVSQQGLVERTLQHTKQIVLQDINVILLFEGNLDSNMFADIPSTEDVHGIIQSLNHGIIIYELI